MPGSGGRHLYTTQPRVVISFLERSPSLNSNPAKVERRILAWYWSGSCPCNVCHLDLTIRSEYRKICCMCVSSFIVAHIMLPSRSIHRKASLLFFGGGALLLHALAARGLSCQLLGLAVSLGRVAVFASLLHGVLSGSLVLLPG